MRLERRGDVAICKIDIPNTSQNVLNEKVTQDFIKIVEQVRNYFIVGFFELLTLMFIMKIIFRLSVTTPSRQLSSCRARAEASSLEPT